jgi:hypothetical protein
MRKAGLVALGLIATLAGAVALARVEVPARPNRPDVVASPDEVHPTWLAADPPPGARPGPSRVHPAPPAAQPPRGSPGPGHPPRGDDRGHRPDGDYRRHPGWRPHSWAPSPWYRPYPPYYPYDYPYYPYYPPPATWVPGHWEWDGAQWVWQPGYWRYY